MNMSWHDVHPDKVEPGDRVKLVHVKPDGGESLRVYEVEKVGRHKMFTTLVVRYLHSHLFLPRANCWTDPSVSTKPTRKRLRSYEWVTVKAGAVA